MKPIGLLQRRLHPVQAHDLVGRADEGAFRARAVVAQDVDDERVLELAQLLDRVDDAPDLVVGVLEEVGVVFRLTREQLAVLFGWLSHAGICSGRSVSLLPAGMMPALSWFSWTISRYLSQPMSKRPAFLPRQSSGGWCGACAAPVEK